MNSNLPTPTEAMLNLRIEVDAELRRLGWHWRHPKIQTWLQRVSAVTGRSCTMVADLDEAAMRSLLNKLRAIPNQLEIGGING